MNIVFRADASIHIGSGHIMRCLVLAKLLTAKGHQVSFATRPQTCDFVDYLKSQNMPVIRLKQPKKSINPRFEADYTSWLQVSWQDDAHDFIDKVKIADIVVVDHYALNRNWEQTIANAMKVKVFAIDDIVREHFAELILDQTFGRNTSEYMKKNSNSQILVGSDFSLLAEGFSQLRLANAYCSQPNNNYKILVSMGAIDKPNVTLKILEKLNILDIDNTTVTVLLSKRAPSYESIKNFCLLNNKFKHIDFVENMAELMAEHHIAIGAPGSTSWERACLGLPSIIIPIAENQIDIAKNVAGSGAAILLNINDIENGLSSALNEISTNWQRYHESSLALVDGQGATRVVNTIEQL
ncbi:UDP-2,4-diacetamido-2,4,6-trideoxy-beta-L-altropyranose hydrolase [Colwellia sp. Arc7-635]|uniref:UDP-2,4-diacetamido-2,4, 6-trideoxy-beta-L-altropyranose hydrolase n=1 Tax=Colwellia sp. Arc7-635 TaxID=2497879 RepID=UPI0013DEACB8|nr:UDP-2,4-diacetamido-2,4,6-trideoxy-beta-L-altropyranose hydrolase [Colwellia sp. Arc7-635]